MNLRQLEAFRATMRSGSITGAAALLHISQPSVSRLIADLERSLGFALFHRQGHGLMPSVEARKFQQSVESMFFGLDKLKDIAESIRTARHESVSLGVIPAFANAVMPEAICALREQNKTLSFDVSVRNTPSVVDDVLLRQIDIGIICPTRHYEGIHILHQTSVPYVCLIPIGHPLGECVGAIDVDRCAEEECVVLDQDYFEHSSATKSPLTTLRKNARIVSRSDPAIAAIACAARLPAVIDPFTATVAAATGDVELRQLRQNVRYPVAIVGRDQESLSIAANGLLEKLVEALQSFSSGSNTSATGIVATALAWGLPSND